MDDLIDLVEVKSEDAPTSPQVSPIVQPAGGAPPATPVSAAKPALPPPRRGISMAFAVVVVITACMLVGIVPQTFAWYVVARSSTLSVTSRLVEDIAQSSFGMLSDQFSDAERVVIQAVTSASHVPGICNHSVVTPPQIDGTLWPRLMEPSLVPPREEWHIAFADYQGAYIGSYGRPRESVFHTVRPIVLWQPVPTVVTRAFLLLNSTESWQLGPEVFFNASGAPTDKRSSVWFRSAMANPGQLTWGPVGVYVSVSMTVQPVGFAEPCGVVFAGMSLNAVSGRLREVRVGESGILWIVDSTTEMLVFSTANVSSLLSTGSYNLSRLVIANSSDPLTRDAGTIGLDLLRRDLDEALHRVVLNGARYDLFVRVFDLRPSSGFPPLVMVIALPVADYFNDIDISISVMFGLSLVIIAIACAAAASLTLLVSRPLLRTVRQLELSADLQHRRPDPADQQQKHQRVNRRVTILSEVALIERSVRKIRTLLENFHRYAPLEILSALQRGGDIAQLGLTRTVGCTVLVCEVPELAALREADAAPAQQDLVRSFAAFMDAVGSSVAHKSGILQRFDEARIVVAWCPPSAAANSAELACKCALSIMAKLASLRQSWRVQGLPILDCRIGISTGVALVGNIGSSRRFSWTVVGPAADIASRIVQANESLETKIIISKEVADSVSGILALRKMPRFRISGKTHETFELIFDADNHDVLRAAKVFSEAVSSIESGDIAGAKPKLEECIRLVPLDTIARWLLTSIDGWMPRLSEYDGSLSTIALPL